LELDGKPVKVRKHFKNISEKMVRVALQKLLPSGVLKTEKRGGQ
jgi:hypothetical protein